MCTVKKHSTKIDSQPYYSDNSVLAAVKFQRKHRLFSTYFLFSVSQIFRPDLDIIYIYIYNG